jgi:hypothetical protein
MIEYGEKFNRALNVTRKTAFAILVVSKASHYCTPLP